MKLKSNPELNSKVIIINGPRAIGKSFIAKFLAKEYNDVILIDGQKIKEFTINRNESTIETQLAYKAFAILTNMYLEAGYQTVIIDYTFENDLQLKKFMNFYTHKSNIYFYTLFNDIDDILNNIDFKNSKYLKQNIINSWENFYTNIDNFGTIIYNNRAVSEIVDSIYELADSKKGKVEYKNKKLWFKDA